MDAEDEAKTEPARIQVKYRVLDKLTRTPMRAAEVRRFTKGVEFNLGTTDEGGQVTEATDEVQLAAASTFKATISSPWGPQVFECERDPGADDGANRVTDLFVEAIARLIVEVIDGREASARDDRKDVRLMAATWPKVEEVVEALTDEQRSRLNSCYEDRRLESTGITPGAVALVVYHQELRKIKGCREALLLQFSKAIEYGTPVTLDVPYTGEIVVDVDPGGARPERRSAIVRQGRITTLQMTVGRRPLIRGRVIHAKTHEPFAQAPVVVILKEEVDLSGPIPPGTAYSFVPENGTKREVTTGARAKTDKDGYFKIPAAFGVRGFAYCVVAGHAIGWVTYPLDERLEAEITILIDDLPNAPKSQVLKAGVPQRHVELVASETTPTEQFFQIQYPPVTTDADGFCDLRQLIEGRRYSIIKPAPDPGTQMTEWTYRHGIAIELP